MARTVPASRGLPDFTETEPLSTPTAASRVYAGVVADHPQPTAAGRLAMRRAQLAAMGPSARDMTGATMARRARLERSIAALEKQVAEQLALPVIPDVVELVTDHGVEQITMALHDADDLDDWERERTLDSMLG